MPKYKQAEGLVFTLACQGAVNTPAPVCYVTYPVHIKPEQPHVLSPDSFVTIRTIQQNVRRSQRALRISTQQSACDLSNRHIEFHGETLALLPQNLNG